MMINSSRSIILQRNQYHRSFQTNFLIKKKPSKPLISAEVDCPSCMGSLQPLPAKKAQCIEWELHDMEAERFLCQNLFEDADFKADSTSCTLYRQNFGNLLFNMTDESCLENYCFMCHDAKPPKSFHGDTINWV
ncbi:unnamed protein product [Clavelina lepadiformis]|uniref:Uncharacterized protein n=1 Tax=Clavelina lepadiformis TaxID=159417 RepID=A0ABP0FWH6_CLALP